MRYGTKSTVENYRALDVRSLARDGVLQAGYVCQWFWSRDGEKVASIGIKSETHSIRLIYNANGEPQDYRVRLDWTACHYGGSRAWLICPAVGCGRRVAKLYGGAIFACRHCHQLNYASQQWSRADRANNSSWRLRRKMGWDLGWMDCPAECLPRPKGQHQKTHARHIARLQRYEADADASFEAVTARLSERLKRLG